jgi:hypothetical protein
MSTPEGKIKNKLDTMLKKEKIWFFSPQAGPYGDSGVHDRIACVYGLFVSIEAKADAKKKMTPKQILKATQVTKAGGIFFLVYDDASIERVRQFINNVRSYRTRQESNSGSDPRPGDIVKSYLDWETGERKFVYHPA